MKIYINFSVLIGMLFFASISNGQTSYKKYVRTKSPFQTDTIFNKYNAAPASSSAMNHIWLINLSDQYSDTTKHKINACAIPEYHEIKNKGLFGYNINKQMAAGLYYHPFINYTNQPGSLRNNFIPSNGSYSIVPYGYSPYTIKATGSPYYILPKF